MNLTIQHVPAGYAIQAWPLVEPFLVKAIPYGRGDYTLDQIRLMVGMGQWVLLAAVDESGAVHGAATISFISYPNSRVAFITFFGGKFIVGEDTYRQFAELMRQQGATKIQGAMRPSMARLSKLYGFEEVTTIMEATI